MGIDTTGYKIVLVLHLVSVIVGFGGIFLNLAYGLQARARRGAEGMAIAESIYNVSRKWTEWFIYAVPVFGIALVMMSDDFFQFSDTWISASFVVYIVAVGLLHGLQFPNLKKMNVLMAELAQGGAGGPGGEKAAELEKRGKRAAVVGGAFNLLIVVAICLMVFRPGS